MPTPIEEMRIVAERLQPLEMPFAFLGGAVMSVLVDHPEATQIRPTKDVDVVVGAIADSEFAHLEQRMRELGFQHDTSEGAPICRWIVDGCTVDIMPQEASGLGMNCRWFPEALEFAEELDLGGYLARVVSSPIFIATKLEAFKDRGKGDYLMSHDLEDIVTLVEGRSNITAEMQDAPGQVQRFVASEFKKLVNNPDFMDAVYSHLHSLEIPDQFETVSQKFRTFAELSPNG